MAIPASPDIRQLATADGAIVFDAALAGPAFDAADFDPDSSRRRASVDALGAGRGAAVRVRAEGRDWVLRHYRRGGMARVLGDLYLWNDAERTRGFQEFRLLAELRRRGLNVPAPVAARYRRSGVHYRADLITAHIDAARTLATRIADARVDATEAGRIGAAIAEFHAHGVYHADLNAHNVLVDAQRVWLIDFDRGALRPPARAWQLANLMRLRRSLLKVGAARDGEASFDQAFWRPLAAAWERALGGFPAAAAGSARG